MHPGHREEKNAKHRDTKSRKGKHRVRKVSVPLKSSAFIELITVIQKCAQNTRVHTEP